MIRMNKIDEELEHIRAEKMRKMMDEQQEQTDNTWMFIRAVEGALRDGVIHRDIHGNRLNTATEICDALLKDGVIYLEDRK